MIGFYLECELEDEERDRAQSQKQNFDRIDSDGFNHQRVAYLD
jgi:hypothetical protein